MSVDHFEYRDLALTVDRGAMGQPSIITLDWVVVDDEGQDHDLKLTLGCELLIDEAESVRELSIVSICGQKRAVADFREFVGGRSGFEVLDTCEYNHDRLLQAAEGLGRALLLQDARDRYPTLFLKVLP